MRNKYMQIYRKHYDLWLYESNYIIWAKIEQLHAYCILLGFAVDEKPWLNHKRT